MGGRKFEMNYGGFLGLVLVLLSLLFWVAGVDEQESMIPSLLNNGVIIMFLFYAITQYRDIENDGLISYGKGVKIGTTIAFFSSVIMAFYTFIYISYLMSHTLTIVINPNFHKDPFFYKNSYPKIEPL